MHAETLPRAEPRFALKEWGVIERALAEGRVTVLIRKGGIFERRGAFQVEHRDFWLFPTRFHQNPEELRPEFRPFLQAAETEHPDAEQVRIEHYAVVTDALRVENLPALERLEGLHPLTRQTVRSRFAYRNRPCLHLLVLRVYRLPEPHRIANTADYEGCISWVELDETLSVEGARPVLSDAEFEARRAEILDRLGEDGVTRV